MSPTWCMECWIKQKQRTPATWIVDDDPLCDGCKARLGHGVYIGQRIAQTTITETKNVETSAATGINSQEPKQPKRSKEQPAVAEQRWSRKRKDIDEELVREMYADGHSKNQIAKHFGVSYAPISRILKDAPEPEQKQPRSKPTKKLGRKAKRSPAPPIAVTASPETDTVVRVSLEVSEPILDFIWSKLTLEQKRDLFQGAQFPEAHA